MTDRNGSAPGSPSFLGALGLGLRMMLRQPWLAAAFLGATLAQGALQGLLIVVLRHVLAGVSTSAASATSSLALGAGMIFGVWLLRSFSVFAAETFSVHLSHRVEMSSMLEVLQKLLRLSVRFFDQSDQSEVVMAAYHDLKGIRLVTFEVGRVVLFVSQLLGLAVAAWLMSPMLAVIGLVAVPLGVLPAYWFGQGITRGARGEREAVSSLYQSFLQVATGIRVIKVNRSEGRVLDRARQIGRDFHRHMVHQALQRGFARLLLEGVSGIGLIVMLTLGGFQVAAGQLSWQSLLGLLIAMMAVYGPAIGLLQLYSGIRAVIPKLDRIETIRSLPIEVADRPDARRLTGRPSTIELRAVTFRHGDHVVLDGVSATFAAGERIGIVGPSGAGKTTLLSLLLRFYDPSEGAILLDGVDLRDIRLADWMDLVSMVLQEPVLFPESVLTNVRLGRPDASPAEVEAACRAANIHDEVSRMEHGYDTVVGVGTDARGVSVGQKQRLCIAAALLKNAPVLLLDEATSSLDSLSERRVQHAVERLMEGRTTFVVAHRFSTLRNVDRILVLDQGRLVGLGRHEELLAGCPAYVALWQSQGSPPIGDRPTRRSESIRRGLA